MCIELHSDNWWGQAETPQDIIQDNFNTAAFSHLTGSRKYKPVILDTMTRAIIALYLVDMQG